MVKNKDQVLTYLREHKQEFLERYGIERIGLFGSVLRDELRDDSDIDLAIEMATSHKSLRNFLAFKRELEQGLQRPIDLGIESSLKPAVKASIERDIFYV